MDVAWGSHSDNGLVQVAGESTPFNSNWEVILVVGVVVISHQYPVVEVVVEVVAVVVVVRVAGESTPFNSNWEVFVLLY